MGDETTVHPHVPVQLPSGAAVAILMIFTGMGLLTDGGASGWIFGVWLVAGAVAANALVRPVGLWVVVPAPPITLLAVTAGQAVWRGQPLWGKKKELIAVLSRPYLHGFPWIAAAVGAGVVITIVRLVVRRRARH